jgi:hypothetical protein
MLYTLICHGRWYAMGVDTPFLLIHLLYQHALSVSSSIRWYPISVDAKKLQRTLLLSASFCRRFKPLDLFAEQTPRASREDGCRPQLSRARPRTSLFCHDRGITSRRLEAQEHALPHALPPLNLGLGYILLLENCHFRIVLMGKLLFCLFWEKVRILDNASIIKFYPLNCFSFDRE